MTEKLIQYIKEKFPQFLFKEEAVHSNIPTVFIKSEGIIPVLEGLKSDSEWNLNFLNDLTAIDWLDKKEPRFEVNYLLRSNNNPKTRVCIKVPVDDGESIPSIVPLFKGANWPEREVWDLFGIPFLRHPSLDRLIMPDNFQGHPLRKDYPLEGFGQDYLIEDLLTMHVEDDIEGSA